MTKIFSCYDEFLNREDKRINGVSLKFSKENPLWMVDNSFSTGCWNCTKCNWCIDCYKCSFCINCYKCEKSHYCVGCSNSSLCRHSQNCHDCYDCNECRNCKYCGGCKYSSNCKYCEGSIAIQYKCNIVNFNPCNVKINNIHQKVLDAVTKNKLEVGVLSCEEIYCRDTLFAFIKYKICNATLCRAKGVVEIAGKKGEKLREKFGLIFAAMLIYSNSSNIEVSINQFFGTNEDVIQDVIRCSELERNLKKSDD